MAAQIERSAIIVITSIIYQMNYLLVKSTLLSITDILHSSSNGRNLKLYMIKQMYFNTLFMSVVTEWFKELIKNKEL